MIDTRPKFPPAVDIPSQPEVRDQGPTASSVGHAVASAIKARLMPSVDAFDLAILGLTPTEHIEFAFEADVEIISSVPTLTFDQDKFFMPEKTIELAKTPPPKNRRQSREEAARARRKR